MGSVQTLQTRAVLTSSTLFLPRASSLFPRHGKDAEADEAQGSGVVMAVACCRVCAQSAAAEAGSTTGLARHHSPQSVPLVAEPTTAHEGCGMGTVSSVRHLGPGSYSGCMYGFTFQCLSCTRGRELSTDAGYTARNSVRFSHRWKHCSRSISGQRCFAC